MLLLLLAIVTLKVTMLVEQLIAVFTAQMLREQHQEPLRMDAVASVEYGILLHKTVVVSAMAIVEFKLNQDNVSIVPQLTMLQELPMEMNVFVYQISFGVLEP
jgi:heme/copper-type cytochrome/quinol oxidase subunit 2